MKIKAIIDADSILFKAALTTTSSRACRINLKDRLSEIEAFVFADERSLYIKAKGNYRNNIYPDYKANRKGKELDPDVSERLSDAYVYAREELGGIGFDGLEADDLVCIDAYTTMQDPDTKGVICAIDKDMLQIPGVHFNFDKQLLLEQSEDAADLFYWSQCIIGDGADNVPGIRGLGEAKTSKIMANSKLGSRHKIVADQYQKKFGAAWQDYFSQYCTSLWLCRDFEQSWDEWYATLSKDISNEN